MVVMAVYGEAVEGHGPVYLEKEVHMEVMVETDQPVQNQELIRLIIIACH